MRETVRYGGYGGGNSYVSRYGSRKPRQARSILRFDRKTLEVMINQFIAAAILALIFIIVMNIKSPYINKMVDGAKWVVEDDYDFKTQFDVMVKSIQNEIDKIKSVPVSTNNSIGKADAIYTSASVMIMPIDGKISSNFGAREKPSKPGTEEIHKGVDIAGAEGTPIKAVMDGVVIKIEQNNLIGRAVRLKHENGIETLYGHCSEILVKENDSVKQGDIIAKVGHTGNATAPHVHFEVIDNGKQIDPLGVIGGLAQPK